MNANAKFDEVIATLRTLVGKAKALPGFNTPDDIKALITSFANQVEAGDQKALSAGLNAIAGLRNKICGFIIFSVTEKKGQQAPVRTPYFVKQFALRKEEKYDKDILDKLAVKIGELTRAVNDEKGEEIERRVAAYQVAHAALAEADAEQKRRDETRDKRAIVGKKARMEAEANAATERNRKRDAEERQSERARRREVASEILELVS